jgi:hypothetical protein
MFWQGLFRPALLLGGRNGRFCFRAPLKAGVRMAGFALLAKRNGPSADPEFATNQALRPSSIG